MKVLDYLALYNPFDTTDIRLHSLTFGIAAADSDNINCDDVEEVGDRIVQKMNDANFKDVKMRRADQVRTLAEVTLPMQSIQLERNL